MARIKRKLTAADKAEKKRRRADYMTVFVRVRQRRIKRPQLIEGIPVEEFVCRNADPVWLHQNEMWEFMVRPEDADRKGPDQPGVHEESTGNQNTRNTTG